MYGRKAMSPLKDEKGEPSCDYGHRFISPDSNARMRRLSGWIRYRHRFYERWDVEPEQRLYKTPPPRPFFYQRTPPSSSRIERRRLQALEKGPAPMDYDPNYPEVGQAGPSKRGRSSTFNVHDTDDMEDVVRVSEMESQHDWTLPGSSGVRDEVSSPRTLGPKVPAQDVEPLETIQDEAPVTEPSDSADGHLPSSGHSPSRLSPVLNPNPEAEKAHHSILDGLRKRSVYRQTHGSWGAKAVLCDGANFDWGSEEFFGPGSACIPFRGVTKGPFLKPDFISVLLSSDTESESDSTHDASGSHLTHEASDSYLTQGLKTTAGIVNKLKTKVEKLSNSNKESAETGGSNGWFGRVKESVGKTASQLLQVRDFSGLVEACKPDLALLTKPCSDFALGTALRILEKTESSLNNQIKEKRKKRKRERNALDARPKKEAKRDVIFKKAKRTRSEPTV